ncbi:MAG: transcriptional regulator TetR family protein [Marmoricola sp.]|nr:transcriptional regulator TetR family protein [Marmoricola sp.]
MPRSQAERREATRAALVAVGTRLFAERSFGDVPAEEIVAAAGVSRGALHHHYGDKRGLFRAVFTHVEAGITEELALGAASLGDDLSVPAVLNLFLDICERPEVRRIALVDAPAVLGWQEWREIEAEYGLGLLIGFLEASPVVTADVPAPVLAQLVLSSITEAALMIANAADPGVARRAAEATLLSLYGGLLG